MCLCMSACVRLDSSVLLILNDAVGIAEMAYDDDLLKWTTAGGLNLYTKYKCT